MTIKNIILANRKTRLFFEDGEYWALWEDVANNLGMTENELDKLLELDKKPDDYADVGAFWDSIDSISGYFDMYTSNAEDWFGINAVGIEKLLLPKISAEDAQDYLQWLINSIKSEEAT